MSTYQLRRLPWIVRSLTTSRCGSVVWPVVLEHYTNTFLQTYNADLKRKLQDVYESRNGCNSSITQKELNWGNVSVGGSVHPLIFDIFRSSFYSSYSVRLKLRWVILTISTITRGRHFDFTSGGAVGASCPLHFKIDPFSAFFRLVCNMVQWYLTSVCTITRGLRRNFFSGTPSLIGNKIISLSHIMVMSPCHIVLPIRIRPL